MQITIGQLYEAQYALRILVNKELPIRSALKIRQLARVIEAHITDANAERDKLIERYGKKNTNGELERGEGNTILLVDPQAFQTAWGELLAAEVEIDDKLRLVEKDLGEGEIEPRALIAFGDLLEEEDE